MIRAFKHLPLVAVAFSAAGCIHGDRAADRILTIYQMQDMRTDTGSFQIDASRLPPDAIESRVDRGSNGDPVTSITLKQDYPVKIMLVPATQPRAAGRAE